MSTELSEKAVEVSTKHASITFDELKFLMRMLIENRHSVKYDKAHATSGGSRKERLESIQI